MRLAMLSTFYPPHHFGGDAVFVYRLSHALADQGHEVDVYYNQDAYRALSNGEAAPGYPDHPGVRRVPLRNPLGFVDLLAMQQTGRPVLHARALSRLFASERYDVLHFHNVSLMGAPELLARARQSTAISLLTLHDHWLVCPMHVLWRYDREACMERTCVRCQLHGRRPPQLWRYTGLRDRAVECVDAVLAPSRFTRDKHRELGLRANPLLLPHFVSRPISADHDASPPHDRPYFLFAGRLERLKGAHTLVEAFRRFRGPDLVLAGDGQQRTSLEAMARDLPNVRFVGRLPAHELSRYYRYARAAIVPSLCYEVFGLTAIEALSVGTPVVVRDLGALPELVRESRAGFTYGSDDQLLEILGQLASDDALRFELSGRAEEAYRANWTVERHLNRYFGVIAELQAERRRRARAPRPESGFQKP